jgi:hypothetical protein
LGAQVFLRLSGGNSFTNFHPISFNIKLVR